MLEKETEYLRRKVIFLEGAKTKDKQTKARRLLKVMIWD